MTLNNLKRIRLEHNMTTTQLAVLCGMTERNVTRIESGKGTTLGTGKKIAKVLKVKLEKLI